MAPSRFGLQGAINKWVSLNASSSSVPPSEDDVTIRHGDRGAAAAAAAAAAAPGGGASVVRKKTSYPRKHVASSSSASVRSSKSASQHDDEATTVCSSSTLGTKSLAASAAVAQQQQKQAAALVLGPSSGTLAPGNDPSNRLCATHPAVPTVAQDDNDDGDDVSRASSKRRKRSISSQSRQLLFQLQLQHQHQHQHQHQEQQQQSYSNSCDAQSVASAPAVSASALAGTARLFATGRIPVGVPLPSTGSIPLSVPPTAPGVYYGVDYSAAQSLPPTRPPSRAGSVASSPALASASASAAHSHASARSSEPGAVGGPPPTSLFHPLCPGAPPPVPPGGVVVTAHGLAPADPTAAAAAMAKMMAAHNHHASGAASLPGSVAGGAARVGGTRSRNRVRGIRSSYSGAASVASASSSVSGRRSRASTNTASASYSQQRKPVVLEFRDWGAANTSTNHPATTMAMDISADPSPTPPPLLVISHPTHMQTGTSSSGTHHHHHLHHQTPPPTSSSQQQHHRAVVGPVRPPTTQTHRIPLRYHGQPPPAFPPGAAIVHGDLPPPRKGAQVQHVQHVVHSATPSPGPGMADLQAKMEAALVLTCLGGASPAPPAYAHTPGHPTLAANSTATANQTPQGQGDGVQRTSSEESNENHPNGGTADAAPIYSSSDGYDGSAEEEGNKSPEPSTAATATANPTSAAPRRFLKGGKRGKDKGLKRTNSKTRIKK